MKEIREIRTDHIDDENVQHIDVWFDDDDNSEGKTVAVICLDTLKVFYFDNDYRVNVRVKEAIQEILTPYTSIQWKCGECGSDDVEMKAWVKPNLNNRYSDSAGEEIADNYCNECGEHTELVEK